MKRSILIVFSFCCSLIASAQHTQNLTGLQKNDSLLLKTHRYARFDVSSLMDNIQPPADTLAAIQKTYKEHLAVKTLLIDECIDNQINIQWWQKYTKRMQVIGMGYDAISLFFKGTFSKIYIPAIFLILYTGFLLAVYLITPHDLKYHLWSSIDRTLMPVNLLMFCIGILIFKKHRHL